MPYSGAQVTRLGLAAIPRALYGSFAGKSEAAPEPEVAAEQPTGGWFFWSAYESEQARRRTERERRERLEEQTAEIVDDLDFAIAAEQRRIEAEEARRDELARLTRLAERSRADLEARTDAAVARAAERAIVQRNFAAMEALERELARYREEEQFLLEATLLLLNYG